jgi:hypothetical protein
LQSHPLRNGNGQRNANRRFNGSVSDYHAHSLFYFSVPESLYTII